MFIHSYADSSLDHLILTPHNENATVKVSNTEDKSIIRFSSESNQAKTECSLLSQHLSATVQQVKIRAVNLTCVRRMSFVHH